MRIAQIAPLYESVPPRLYGGTERVVSWLAEALVDEGHDVALFASGGSVTRGDLRTIGVEALRLSGTGEPDTAAHYRLLEEVLRHADEFDVLHFHTDYVHYPFMRRKRCPHLTTLHGRLDLAGLTELYDEYREEPLVSISNDQARALPDANWVGTVYHGLPRDLHEPTFAEGSYLAFLGRISPEKGPERAIEIARRAGLPLKIAAKVDEADRAYHEAVVKPLLDDPLVEFVGEVDEAQKTAFLGDATALLFPIDWPEPFGLVMIEAMACGTPVLAFRAGSVPEVIDEGITGLVVDGIDAAVEAVGRIGALDRRACRARFDERFSATRMARDYLRLYERVIDVPTLPRTGSGMAVPFASRARLP